MISANGDIDMHEPNESKQYKVIRDGGCAQHGGGVAGKGSVIKATSAAERSFYERREADGDVEAVTEVSKSISGGKK